MGGKPEKLTLAQGLLSSHYRRSREGTLQGDLI